MSFGDVAKKINVKVDRRNCPIERYVAGEHMRTDDLRIRDWGLIGNDYLGPAFNQKFTPGQILYGSRRTYLRKVAVADFEGICANTTFVIEPTGNQLVPELLPFVMQSRAFTEHSIRMSKGSTNPYVNWKDLTCYEFAVPRTEEQHKMAKLLLTVEETLAKHESLLKRCEILRKALVRELFTKGIGHKEFRNTEIGRIPSDWIISTLGGLLEICQYGLSAKMGDKGMYPIVRMNELADGSVVSTVKKRVDLDSKTFEQFRLLKGDILFNRTNSYELVGRAGVFLLEGNYVFASYLIRLRADPKIVSPAFLAFCLISSQDRLRRIAAKAVQQANINVTNLKRFKIPLPPLPEQQKIVYILTTTEITLNRARESTKAARAMKMELINHLLSTGIVQ